MKKCLIISGGKKSIIPVANGDYFVIACDRGYQYAMEEQCKVDLLIGDFDSYNDELPYNIEIEKLPCEKDDTDTMHAVRVALEKGYKDITICCALGGRLDHLFSNIQTGAFVKNNGADIRIIDDDTEIYYIEAEEKSFVKREGWYFSMFSYGELCEGVSIKGAKYEGDNLSITNLFPLGQSNEWIDEEITVRNSAGMLLIFLSKSY